MKNVFSSLLKRTRKLLVIQGCIFSNGMKAAHIVTIVVDKKYRRKGYETLLMKEMEKFARNKVFCSFDV